MATLAPQLKKYKLKAGYEDNAKKRFKGKEQFAKLHYNGKDYFLSKITDEMVESWYKDISKSAVFELASTSVAAPSKTTVK